MQATEQSISNSLKRQLSGVDPKKLFDEAKIRECQEIIDTAASKFLDEAFKSVEEIHKLYCEASYDTSLAANRIKTISQLSSQLKGRMGALGLVFCYQISDSLHRYTQKLNSYSPTSLMVVAKHIHALQAALKENCAGDGGVIGKEMVAMLEKLVKRLQ